MYEYVNILTHEYKTVLIISFLLCDPDPDKRYIFFKIKNIPSFWNNLFFPEVGIIYSPSCSS